MYEVMGQCGICKHYWGNQKEKTKNHDDVLKNYYKCDAYPKKIPEKIWFNHFDHRKPYKGDRGIQFEPLDRCKDIIDEIYDGWIEP